MTRQSLYIVQKWKSRKTVTFPKQRILALFFLTLFLSGVFAPTASVYAAALHRPDASNPHIKDKPADSNKPMKQNYPGGLQPVAATIKGAADAKPVVGPIDEITSKPAPLGEALKGVGEKTKPAARELIEKRTPSSTINVNQDGTITEKQYFSPKFFKKEGQWRDIDTSLIEDKNAADSDSVLGRALGNVQSWFSETKAFKVKDNDWQARFAASNAKQGMVRVGKGADQVGFVPVNAKEGVDPVITTSKDGYQIVHYYDLWPGVNVEYIIESTAVKENIILKDRNATSNVSFKLVGAGLEKRVQRQKIGNFEVPTEAYVLKGVANDEFAIAPANLILNNYGFVSDQTAFTQSYQGDTIAMSVAEDYLRGLPDNAFPAVIDPSTFYGTFGTRVSGTYVSLKTDGTVCQSNVCNPYAGSLYDSGNTLRYWRSGVYANYGQLNDPNKTLSNATLHLKQRSNESFWTGTFDAHTYYAGHATCLNNFNCLNGGAFNAAGLVTTAGSIDVTGIYQSRISAGDWGAWLMLGGEDGTTSSFKNFDPGTGPYNSGSYISFTYNGPPAAPNIEAPTSNQVFVDPQPTFSVTYATNPNGSTPLQYQLRVSNAPGGTGFVVASPVQVATRWTVPDNVLQDGATYYVQARSFDPISGLYSGWGTSVAFKIDMRTGTDSTQTYDTLGPVSVNLATGGLTTSAASHSSVAQGGSLGVGLSYNAPLKSRNGLVGEYWNVAANYNGTAPTSTPTLTRMDRNIDFSWDTATPAAGINNDWFYARWTGYFVAPKTGNYQFGGNHDDMLSVKVNNQQQYSSGGCYTGVCYGSSSITLQEGQVVPISIEHQEATGPAYAHVYVKGAVDEKILPTEWLQTGVRKVANKKYGLMGSYFARLDGTNTFSANNYKVMERIDPYPNFNWGTDGPVAGGPGDFLVRWTGYVTVPTTGAYTFGTRSDDGTKIMLGNSNTVVLNDWTTHGAPTTPTWGGSTYTLTANTPTKITVEYYDETGSASHELWIKSTALDLSDRLIPNDWLTTRSPILPEGWDLGVDGSGTAKYNYLMAGQSNVVLTDSSGGAHEYTWTGSGYKPPVNENGYLVRNVDGTFTLQDSDGQVYVFAADGTLSSVTSSPDDRNPAALKYEYQSLNNSPQHLYKIKDGVDDSRTLTLYYSGQSQCGTAPSGFDANAPPDMLCAAQTNDGRTTYFYYVQGQLARVAMPGNSLVDYQYQQVYNAAGALIGYQLVAVRDALANDAIAAGVRTNDDNAKTQIAYDTLGRVSSVTQPAPTTGASRLQHTIEYLPEQKPYIDENGSAVPGYAGMTKQHVTGAAEPKGFIRRIKYDSLYRTIEATDMAGLSTTTEWDPNKDLVYSTTDPASFKSTTVYDDEDRAVSSYGPAPKAWFTTSTPNNQVPQSAYVSQVPRSDVGYEQSIVGPAVSWFDYSKLAGNTAGALIRAPKQHTTGINTSTPGVLSDTFSSPPITASPDVQGIGFSATGKLRLPNGTYTISADTSDGIRVLVDDQVVVNQWVDSAYRTVTGTSFTVGSSAPKRVQIDVYRRTGSTGTLNIKIAQNGGFAATTDWSNYLKPGYDLVTSAKTYDSTVGDSTTNINYGNTPELGLPQSITADPTGLNLSATASYETQGASGSFLRPTKKSRPGDVSTNPAAAYTYYGATTTRDNPCTTAVEAHKQAGLVKFVTNASPNNGSTAGHVSESVYDDAGRIVASRTNTDGWTCTTYDARGRVTQTVIPSFGSEAGRTITNNLAVSGDPTMTSTEDAEGVNVTQIDLLGRTIYYRDAQWNETWTGYDSMGRVSWRSSDIGDESYIYDSYSRLTQHRLDNTTYAVVTYDQYGRTYSVEYPNAGGQKMVVGRDTLGRVNSQTYYASGSQTPGSNLILNPSLEQNSVNTSEPDDWITNSWGTNTSDFTYLNEGFSGTRSVKAEITSYTSGDAKWSFDPVAVAPNTTYTFKDYYKSNVATEVLVQYTHQNQTVSYEWLGSPAANSNWTQTNYNFTTPSTSTSATVLHLVQSVGWLMLDDAELYATSSGSQTVIASDQVTLSQSGKIVSGTENGQSKSFTYDLAGRLTNATIGTNTYAYGFGNQSGSCASGTNANSGKNSNRTSQTINGVTTTYCYDYADRLVSSSDPLANGAQYDSHGNMTAIGTGTTPLYMYYDSSDRNWGFEQYDSSGNGKAVYSSRDVQGRITHRESDNITGWNWTMADEKWYGYTGNNGSPSIVRNANWDIVEKYLTLPGGVLMTVRPQQSGNANKVYSLPNLHGSVMATTNASGALSGTFRYDPFGNKISSTLPDNTQSGTVLGWAGSHRKFTESNLALTPIQMGARVYLPTLGRFAQTDPVPGGNVNDYVYAVDPINTNDFSGRFLQGGSGASFLQPAAGAVRVQPAAPAPFYQAAVGTRHYQNAVVANRGIIRTPAPSTPAPKPRDDSTRMQVATVRLLPIFENIKHNSPYAPSGDVARENFNLLQAAGTAKEWYDGGVLIGGTAGCTIGGLATFYAGGVGCIPAAAFGSQVGGISFAIVGFFVGGYDAPTKDAFSWGPDKVYTGR